MNVSVLCATTYDTSLKCIAEKYKVDMLASYYFKHPCTKSVSMLSILYNNKTSNIRRKLKKLFFPMLDGNTILIKLISVSVQDVRVSL